MLSILRKGGLLAAPAFFALATSALAQGSVSMSDWQMHTGKGKVTYGADLDPKALGGDLEAWFQHADVPLEDDAGWHAAPNPASIAFEAVSTLETAECKKAVDHTYFQTVVNVPEGVVVSKFDISLADMDDIARISIYNPAHPDGSIVAGSYVRRGQPALETSDLKDLLVQGNNRVVITLLDNCGGGNNLKQATVVLNGAPVPVVEAVAEAEPAAEEQLCSPQTGDMFQISFVNNTDRKVSFHWMEFDCKEGGGPVLEPGQTEMGIIGAGHIFRVRDADGALIGKFVGESGTDFVVQ